MIGKYFSRKNEQNFYLPGQEIKIGKRSAFNTYTCEKDPLSMCKNRVAFAVLSFALIYMVICVRLFDVCISDKFNIKTADNDVDTFSVLSQSPIKRADILDRNGAIIATSLPTVNLYANPKKILNAEKAAQDLSTVLVDMRYEDILAKLKHRGKFVYIKRNLSPSQQYQINYLGIPGLEFENGEKRIYPQKGLFAHVVGQTNIDNSGISGIEKELDDRLTHSDIPLQLTIDAGIQDTIRGQLKEAVTKFNAEGAAAILMDVKTSEIIALVSVPDFDPNSGKFPTERSQFNFTTSGLYEPGSVFKVFNAAMGLESGKVKVADKFDATKPLKLRYNTIKDYRGENRWLNVPEILIYSSNIGSAQIALKVGKSEQQHFLENLGLFKKMEIELAEKAKPIVPRRWGEETTATVAYGYGISVTPLHVITGFSSIVNGGVYHNPTLVKSDTTKDNGHRVISYETSKSMRELLRLVVTQGSGKRANVTGYEVAGKTGTANKLVNGKYVDKKVMTTFVSTFPVSNPKYSLLVMLDEPKATKETWGFVTSGWNCVPTANKIITAIAPQLNIKANFDLDEARKARIIEASYSK